MILADATWQKWQAAIRARGFRAMAAAPAARAQCGETVRQWLAQSHHADMAWFERNLDKRLDPRLVVEGAQSVIMLTAAYWPKPVQLGPFKLARYAAGSDYHEILKDALMGFCTEHLQPLGANYRVYVDTGPLLERYWAQQAGLGWIGRSGNLISRKDGSYLFLAGIITDLKVPYGEPHRDFCGTCRACIDACPTEAITEQRTVDSKRCISYLTIEHRGPLPNLPFDNWLFGCDICQEVCPWPQKFATEPERSEFEPRPVYAQLTEEQLAGADAIQFAEWFRRSPIKRTKLAGFLRNIVHLKEKNPKLKA